MEQKMKKIPLRQCSGCGGHFPKKELLRVVRGEGGTISLDFTGKKSGRGAYICPDKACFPNFPPNPEMQKTQELND